MGTFILFFGEMYNVWRICRAGTALLFYVHVLRNLKSIARSRKLYAADLSLTGKVEFQFYGKRLEFDLDQLRAAGGNPFAFFREFLGRDVYFRAFDFDRLNFDICVDLGANIGLVSEVLSHFGNQRNLVIGIDGEYNDHAYTLDLLKRHANIRRVPKAVLDGESDSIKRYSECFNSTDIEYTTMGDVMQEFGIERISFMKIDIEGGEFVVLTNNNDWLELVDNISIEVHPAAGDPEVLVASLRAHGFSLAWTDDFGKRVTPKTMDYLYASRNGALRPRCRGD